MRGDWKDFRPAIWLAMLGIAVIIVVVPHYLGAILLGAAIGTAIRIRQRRARIAQQSQRSQRSQSGRRSRRGPG
jgi:uncharacterized membrane protein YqgA involved in biofilm formation